MSTLPYSKPEGSTNTLAANRSPPTWLHSQTWPGRNGSSTAATGRPLMAQQTSWVPCAHTAYSGTVLAADDPESAVPERLSSSPATSSSSSSASCVEVAPHAWLLARDGSRPPPTSAARRPPPVPADGWRGPECPAGTTSRPGDGRLPDRTWSRADRLFPRDLAARPTTSGTPGMRCRAWGLRADRPGRRSVPIAPGRDRSSPRSTIRLDRANGSCGRRDHDAFAQQAPGHHQLFLGVEVDTVPGLEHFSRQCELAAPGRSGPAS